MLGAVLGVLAAGGLLLAGSRVVAIRRTSLETRVLPYVREAARSGSPAATRLRGVSSAAAPLSASPLAAATGIFGPVLRRSADGVEKVLGGSASVARRLDRAGLGLTVHEFRIEQVVWGLVGFAVGSAWQILAALRGGGGVVSGLLLCACAFVTGVVLRDQRLTAQAKARDRAILTEFPVLAELLALAVASGESPVAALDRVVHRSRGELAVDLGRVLGEIRTGEPVGQAFERLAATSGVPIVAQFAQGIAIAVERGTPLADVLHAQAADVREAGRRALIESAARREVFMLVPVVFLVLPVVILFALFPGAVGLRLTAP